MYCDRCGEYISEHYVRTSDGYCMCEDCRKAMWANMNGMGPIKGLRTSPNDLKGLKDLAPQGRMKGRPVKSQEEVMSVALQKKIASLRTKIQNKDYGKDGKYGLATQYVEAVRKFYNYSQEEALENFNRNFPNFYKE